ncbi:hypothetical protein L7F22_063461 [Adiantum nelumboides]|nr:hypothetical protein [Adiantum nelumboides]
MAPSPSPAPGLAVREEAHRRGARGDRGTRRLHHQHHAHHQPHPRHSHKHHHPHHLYSPRRDSNPFFRYDSTDSIQGFQGFPGKHSLSHNNQSIHDLSLLDTLIDQRGGQYEWARSSDETLAELGKRKKNGSQLRKYYENINAILDGWREVDEILESRFPQEVMSRFGTVEEVERVKTRSRHRLFSGRHSTDVDTHEDEDTGYMEESEDDSDLETGPRGGKPRKRTDSFTTRAANAFSGFWFGTSVKSNRGDEVSPLVKSTSSPRTASPPAPSTNRYGSTGNGSAINTFSGVGHGLTTIDDSAERSPAQGEAELAHEDAHVFDDSRKGKAGEVRASTAQGRPVAVENEWKPNGSTAKGAKRRNRRIIDDISNSDSDDELDESSATEQRDSKSGRSGDAEGSLDRKLAMERSERKTRARHRDVLMPGTSGTVVRVDRSASTGKDTASDAAEGNETAKGKLSHPGGISERDRIKLLEHVPGRAEREEGKEKGASFAININLAVNVLLLAGKVVAVFSSNSVSLIASLVDSALDLLSTVIIFGTTKAVNYRSWATYFKYPVGKKRFEPSVWSSSVSSWSHPFVSESSGVRAVAQDAENDVVLNVASLIFPVIGSKLGWPALDPIGGIALSLYIIWEWLETLAETITKLSGAVASSSDISRALYLVTRFRSVNSISAFELYHSGDNMIAEADMVLPHSIPLKEAHDLGEVIVYCAESLSDIERVYVVSCDRERTARLTKKGKDRAANSKRKRFSRTDVKKEEREEAARRPNKRIASSRKQQDIARKQDTEEEEDDDDDLSDIDDSLIKSLGLGKKGKGKAKEEQPTISVADYCFDSDDELKAVLGASRAAAGGGGFVDDEETEDERPVMQRLRASAPYDRFPNARRTRFHQVTRKALTAASSRSLMTWAGMTATFPMKTMDRPASATARMQSPGLVQGRRLRYRSRAMRRREEEEEEDSELSDSEGESVDVPLAATAGPSAGADVNAAYETAKQRAKRLKREQREARAEARAKRMGKRRAKKRSQYEKNYDALVQHHPELKKIWTDLAATPSQKPEMANQPDGLNIKLLPFQREGLNWLIKQEKIALEGRRPGRRDGYGQDYPDHQPVPLRSKDTQPRRGAYGGHSPVAQRN